MFEFVEICPFCEREIERGDTICADPCSGLSAHAGCVAKFEREQAATGGEA